MNPASRNRSTRSIQTRRPTIASTGSLLSAAFVSTASTTSLPSETSASTSNTIASSYSTSLTSSSKSSKESKGGYSPRFVTLIPVLLLLVLDFIKNIEKLNFEWN